MARAAATRLVLVRGMGLGLGLGLGRVREWLEPLRRAFVHVASGVAAASHVLRAARPSERPLTW